MGGGAGVGGGQGEQEEEDGGEETHQGVDGDADRVPVRGRICTASDRTGDVQHFPGLFLYAVGSPHDGTDLESCSQATSGTAWATARY